MKRPRDLITTFAAAQLADISRQAVDDAIARGALRGYEVIIKAVRVSRAEVLAYKKRTGGKSGRPRGMAKRQVQK